MSNRSSLAFCCFAVSLAVHAGGFVFLGLLEDGFVHPTDRLGSMTVRIDQQRHQKITLKNVGPQRNESENKRALRPKPGLELTVPAKSEFKSPDHENQVLESDHDEPQESEDSKLRESPTEEHWSHAFTTDRFGADTPPCRTLSLPPQWARLKDVWPRRYKVELRLTHDTENDLITLVSMLPVGPQLGALDERVRSSFSDCLKKQNASRKNIRTIQSRALNPSTGEAYSAEIEFYPNSPNVAAQ